MAFINWSEKYSVNVSEMDEQHKKLLAILNEHFEAISQGKSDEILGKIFKELYQYTKIHFSEEEKLMKKYNYPELKTQQAAHQYFIKKIQNFQDDFYNDKKTLSVDVTIFLKEWLLKHISIEDKKYGTYLNNPRI